jgi:hypothetical protein
MKQLLIFLLIAGHIIVTGVAAAVHMTEDCDHDDGSHTNRASLLVKTTVFIN